MDLRAFIVDGVCALPEGGAEVGEAHGVPVRNLLQNALILAAVLGAALAAYLWIVP